MTDTRTDSSRRPNHATAVVTGATHGIGRAIALELNARGWDVIATGRDQKALDELQNHGLHPAHLDVTDSDAIRNLSELVAAQPGGLHLLINNAGYGLMGPSTELPLADIRHQFEVNTFAPVALIRALLPSLIEAAGRIVNLSSVSGALATPFAGAYCSSKAALTSLSDTLRMELAPFGVKVLTIQPGHIASDFGATAGALADRDWSASRYADARPAIAARANASQHKATPTPDFARKVVDHILSRRPRPIATFGRGGRPLLFLANWVPAWVRDRALARRFGLRASTPNDTDASARERTI